MYNQLTKPTMKSLKIQESFTNIESTSFKKYLTEVAQIRLLTPDEEYEIAVLAGNGDKRANELLIKHNLRFVISVAKKYKSPTLNLEDLVNEGNLGLIYASRRFDPSRGFKFISYAIWWIRRSILLYINEHGTAIRLPSNKSNMLHKIKIEFDLMEQKLERKPNFNELVDELEHKFSDEDIAFYCDSIDNKIKSLDLMVNNEGSATAFSNLIEDTSALNVEHYTKGEDSKSNVEAILSILDKPHEREVITLLFGLDGKEPLKLRVIGFFLGLSSERVRQVRDIAIRKMQIGLKTSKTHF
jgi:RNA polymerase primary sigma factor